MKQNQISFPFLLGLVFVILKLCKVINWSWWWVTAPFWGSFVVGIVILAVIGFTLLFKLSK